MKISSKRKYKSLSPFDSELGKFTVITGKNGSGKTQFLELFKYLQVENVHIEFTISPAIEPKDIQIEGLDIINQTPMRNDTWQGAVDQLKNSMRLSNSFWDLIDIILERNISITNLDPNDLLDIYANREQSVLLLDTVYRDLYNRPEAISTYYYGDDPDDQLILHLTDLARDLKHKENSIELYQLAAKRVKKRLRDLEYDDFANLPVSPKLLSKASLFYSSVEEIMYNYYKQRHDNLYLRFFSKEFNEENGSIPDKEFLEQYPPPQLKLNEILSKHGINYEIKEINIKHFSRTLTYGFWFVNKFTGEEVAFESLSSGEKIIIGLIFKVFHSFYFNKTLSYPKLLILDEPDAHLHPEMSKMLIDVLQESFVNDFDMNVIMTTHSPSTVAVAPEESLYIIRNHSATSLERTTKDDALRILTDNIPTLSIDYKNHRQIFVEGENDQYYYQTIYNKHQIVADLLHKLYFISYPSGKGSCDVVIQTVNSLKDAGNLTCYGIIDWDSKQTSTERVHVHGQAKRYSIENYLYDPIYLVALFIKDGGANGVYKELAFDPSYDEHDIGSERNERLQEIADWVVEKIKTKYPSMASSSEKISATYLNGKVIELPKWLMVHNGHDLFVKLKNVFPSLDNPKVDENALFKRLTDLIGKCYPFVPEETISVLNAIGK